MPEPPPSGRWPRSAATGIAPASWGPPRYSWSGPPPFARRAPAASSWLACARSWSRLRGPPTTLAALNLGLSAYAAARVQGHHLGTPAIEQLTARLTALPLAERARTPGLEPGRADVIVPGAVALAVALAGLGLPAAVVSNAGLREGILLDAVGWRPPSTPSHGPSHG